MVGCANSEVPFTLDTGALMPGRGILANTATGSTGSSGDTGSGGGSCSSNDGTVVAVGAGVGAPLAVLAAGALAWAWWERRQRRRREARVWAREKGGPAVPKKPTGLVNGSATASTSALGNGTRNGPAVERREFVPLQQTSPVELGSPVRQELHG